MYTDMARPCGLPGLPTSMIRMRTRMMMMMMMRWWWWWWDDEEEEDDDNDDSMISCSMGWVILYLFHGRVGDVIPYVNLEKNARSCTVLLLTSPTHFHLFRLRSINFHWFLCYSGLRQTTGSVRTNMTTHKTDTKDIADIRDVHIH